MNRPNTFLSLLTLQKLPVPSKRDVRNFSTPSKGKEKSQADVSSPTVATKKKYAHIQPKIRSFWTPQEMERVGFKQMFLRKATSSTSTSSTNSMATTPENDYNQNKHKRRSLQYEITGQDFAARLRDLKSGIPKFNKKDFPPEVDVELEYDY